MVRFKETSGGNAMFDGRWRDTVDRGTGPAGRRLQQLGVTADVLTATGLLSATAAAVAIGTGHLHLGILLIILTGLHDLLDGPVAKAESLGIPAKGGLMERAERMILLAIGLLSASFLVSVLWVMLALTTVTAIGRFAKVWRLAEAPVPVSAVRRPRRTRTAMRGERHRDSGSPSRWRARRQGELSSRSGRTWRARHAGQGIRQRAAARRSS